MSRSRRWCFTLNTPTGEEATAIGDVGSLPTVAYLVVGREVSPTTNRRHLQCFIIFTAAKSLTFLKREISARAHWEIARGTSDQAATYCKKDNDYDEYGTFPNQAGHRSDLQVAKEWIDNFVQQESRAPTPRELAQETGVTYIRYAKGLLEYARLVAPSPNLRNGTLREWQEDLAQRIDEDADDRTIHFYVDPNGASGKTWFSQWFLTTYPNKTQIIGVGKRDDMAHSIDDSKYVFFINVPRGQMEFLQYAILEQLKDRMVFSPKYNSCVKVITKTPHVVVFSNEYPDMSKLSNDRYNIKEL